MKKVVAELANIVGRESLGEQIANLWSKYSMLRAPWLAEKLELRNYIFATDTSTTSTGALPWKNSTHLPKLCQIRDNLHANYMSALFPNDNWLKWEGHGEDASTKEKKQAVQAYMANKVRESGFRTEVSKCLYDYIDYGNVFGDIEYVNESTVDDETGEVIPGYIGPKLARISPLDIVFNPIASSFDDTWKITRYVKTLGELKEEVDIKPELRYNSLIVDKAYEVRKNVASFTSEDLQKHVAFSVDGFGSLKDYYQSDYVEILEFEGSIHDKESGTYLKNVIITVVDRSYVIRQERMPSWLGKSTKFHVGWRLRPDNIYAMGPLDNLVGLQYRIDHLENIKADAMDLAVHPPLVIQGNVEEFTWAPGEEIFVGEGGSITELGKNLNGVITADNQIAMIEQKMEELAGAPKQAMGIRTPGEKTAFEVQTLEMAASRIFQHKITHFEIEFVEMALNRMLESGRRNMDGSDLVRVMDTELGVVEFLRLTKEDITASGKIRPVGARHFAAQATLIQNMMGLVSSPLWQDQGVRAHFSGKKIAMMVEELLGLERFAMFQDNVQIMEAAETEQFVRQAQEDIAVTDATPTEAPDVPGAQPEPGMELPQ